MVYEKMRHPIYMLSFICSHNTQCTWPGIHFKLELTVNVSLVGFFLLHTVICTTSLVVLHTGHGWYCIYFIKIVSIKN